MSDSDLDMLARIFYGPSGNGTIGVGQFYRPVQPTIPQPPPAVYRPTQPTAPRLEPKCSYVVPWSVRETNDVLSGKWAENQVAFLASRCGLTVAYVNSLNGNQAPSAYWVPGKAVKLPYCICAWIEQNKKAGLYGVPEDGTLGQFYQAAQPMPPGAVKRTFMFQVFDGGKMVTSTSAETYNNHQALQRRRQLLQQFCGNCYLYDVQQFQFPLTPGEFGNPDFSEPQILSCGNCEVRVYLWGGSNWGFAFWNKDHWAGRYLVRDESLRGVPEESDGTVGQYLPVQPALPTFPLTPPEFRALPAGYRAAPVLPAAAIKRTFMFQVWLIPKYAGASATKMITTTSAETLNDIEALARRKQLLKQFWTWSGCQLPNQPAQLEPYVLSCSISDAYSWVYEVHVYLWNGSGWDHVLWLKDHWGGLSGMNFSR